jgi:hypothetical protein
MLEDLLVAAKMLARLRRFRSASVIDEDSIRTDRAELGWS